MTKSDATYAIEKFSLQVHVYGPGEKVPLKLKAKGVYVLRPDVAAQVSDHLADGQFLTGEQAAMLNRGDTSGFLKTISRGF